MGKLGEVRGIRAKRSNCCYIVVMFKIDTSEIANLESDLKTFKARAFPFATKQTLNRSAFDARKAIQGEISDKMIERNKFTGRSIQVEQTRTLNVNRQAAVVGSTADYMEDQEFGGVKYRKGKEGTPIATTYSAGQGMDSQPRTRLPRRANTLKSIQLQKRRGKGMNRRQRNLVAIKQAAATGFKFVFLDLGRKKGIFRVIGGKRRPKLRMVQDLSEQSVVIPKNPTFAPAVKRTEALMPGIYRDALIFQLKRHKLFR